MSSRTRLCAAICCLALLVSFGSASVMGQTPTLIGARTGVYSDGSHAFVGGEFLTPIVGRFYFSPNAEYVFIKNGTEATFNFDFHYDMPLGCHAFAWAGAGLGILYNNPEGPVGSNTDPAANILFGLGINRGSWIPYIQAKVIASDTSDFVFGGGIRFALE